MLDLEYRERAVRDRLRASLTACALCFGVLSAGAFAAPAAAAPQTKAEVGAHPASETVTHFADWVIASGDNGGLPFVVIDKLDAAVFVFSADGRLTASTPALIGFAHGDDSVPGIGDRELSSIAPEERTTPAGRFLAGFRPSGGKEEILWVDYDTSISLHPLRQVTLSDPREKRQRRLQTPSPTDNRITYGCINVPDAFYDEVVRPAFTGTTGVVYVLPETRALSEVFPTFERHLATSESAQRGKKKKKGFWRFF